MVRSMCLRKKALPGWITEHAKFKRPANDCASLLWPSFSRGSQKLGLCTVKFFFFFAGKRFSTWMVPNLIWAQRPTKRLNCFWHISWEAAVIKNPIIKKVNDMIQGRIQREGSAGAHPSPPPPDDLQLSNTTGILVFAIKICLRHQTVTPFRVLHPLLRKTQDPPLWSMFNLSWATIPKQSWITQMSGTNKD